MADSNVPITSGSGTNVDTRTNTAGEHRQVVVLGEGQALSDLIATFRADSVIRVATDPTTVLVDSFESLDTVNTWTLGGNSNPTQTAGKLVVSAAITASMQSTIRSQPTFVYRSPSYISGAFLATLDAGAVTGNKRVFGFATLPATSTVAIPITNGVVFEVQDTDGALIGAAYSNSTRTQTVALTRPTDGLEHRYAIYYKTSRVYFELDNLIVGSIASPDPQIMNLPITAVSVNAAAGQPGTAAVLTFSTLSVADWGRNGTAIVDGTFPWREAQISAAGALSVAQAALTKGTQGATGVSTQQLHDAGRNQTNYFHAAPIITTTAEVMQTLTGYKGGIAVAATATPAVVTAGKTYRVTSITVHYVAATVIGGALIRLRANLSGVAVVTSPLVKNFYVGQSGAFVAGEVETTCFTFPEGLEFAAGTGIAVGVIGGGAVPTTGTITGYVMLSIEGYEY